MATVSVCLSWGPVRGALLLVGEGSVPSCSLDFSQSPRGAALPAYADAFALLSL